jgi:hypothetical protein
MILLASGIIYQEILLLKVFIVSNLGRGIKLQVT